jgi:hypothetical protein
MRKWNSWLILSLLISAPCWAQSAQVDVRANAGLPRDPRPFGKYLAEICTLVDSADSRQVTCTSPLGATKLVPPAKTKQPVCGHSIVLACQDPGESLHQTISVKLVCGFAGAGPCRLSNPKIGDNFYISATADSGLSVDQAVILGSDHVDTGEMAGGTVRYHANGVGPLIVKATVGAAAPYAAAPPVELILQIAYTANNSEDGSSSCPVLPASPGSLSTPLDAATIVSLMGNPTPFIVTAQGPSNIAIYKTREALSGAEGRILDTLQDDIALLEVRTASSLGITSPPGKPFSVELKIPHASALGDLATRIGTLNYSQFIVQDVGKGFVRVTAPTQPACDLWKNFLTDVREMAWQVVSDPMSKKLFYLSSSDVAAAFSGLSSPGGSGSSSGSGSSPSGSNSSSEPSAGGSGSGSGTASKSASSSGSGASSGGGSSSSSSSNGGPGAANSPSGASSAGASASSPANATISISQPSGSNIEINSDTTPCVVAGLAFGNATGCGGVAGSSSSGGSGSSSGSSGAGNSPTAPAPLAMSSVAVAAGTVEQNPPDLLLYSDTNPGDDAQIEERNRIIAQLDLPRPEMVLSAWVTQNSSASPEAMGSFTNLVKGMVADYDQEFMHVILRGWRSIKEQIATTDYFNEAFRSYIEDRFVADTKTTLPLGSDAQALSQAFLDHSQANLVDPPDPNSRATLKICKRDHYCLGYNELFHPVKPALTDLLLTIIAAQEPVAVADRAVEAIEGERHFEMRTDDDCDAVVSRIVIDNAGGKERRDEARSDIKKRCRAIWHYLDLDHVSPPPAPPDCTKRDFLRILDSLLNDAEPRVHLQCFKEKADQLLLTDSGASPYGAGLIRAAVADFLFNYKMSQQYPHEFASYDLSHSADALNDALSPFIDAFNRDLWSYQLFVRADMQYRVERLNSMTDRRCCAKRLFGLDKPSFFNDGVVTVRTISGQPTSVSVTSQSYLNASSAPQLSAVLSSLAGSGGSGGGSGSNSSTTTTTTGGGTGKSSGGGGANPVALGEIAGVLSNYQTTYAQIGRALSFTATPRSLSTASSAEIAVTLNADESAGGPVYAGAGSGDPSTKTSRVAAHDTTTRVRVDSIKLFEVSSFSAVVQRSHSRFPLLPPFVEIPYIGTFAGVPLGSAKEFHSSTAIISANVVPTASDIAYGLRFVFDLLVDGLNPGPCSFYSGAAGADVKDACVFRKMYSLNDMGDTTLGEFNKQMNRCFSTDTSQDGCLRKVTFANTIRHRY